MKPERPLYIPQYENRKYFCRKIRKTEKEINELKKDGNWKEVSHLSKVLRKAWWGYKRYK
tara:strand:- start:139 stop:318 length:180 start_codon:yes stop_codon:yes gene_type:complete